MKRKKPAAKRIRRSPYERSLEYATNRMTKALAERDKYSQLLADLDKEIPYLQAVIRALTPPEQQAVRDKSDPWWKRLTAEVPTAVKPFVEPISANVDELPSEDDLLNFKVPGEQELLP